MGDYFYETPIGLADLLAKHSPDNINHLLEPSVGTGALLSPFLNEQKKIHKLTAVDVDKEMLTHAESLLMQHGYKNYNLVNENFIDWALVNSRKPNKFDCILMNPPFCSRVENYIDVPGVSNKLPYEIAFLLLSISLLSDKGRLLALVPGSVVSAFKNSWFRKVLIESGAVKLVHELPKYSFPGVESKIYLIVYEHKGRSKNIRLLNKSIINSDELSLPVDQLCDNYRMDFGYIASRKKLEQLHSSCSDWVILSSLVDLFRGKEESPGGKARALHTTDYKNGFWTKDKRHVKDTSTISTHKHDLAIRRVGRDCFNSLGIVQAKLNTVVTDCVFIVRPKNNNKIMQILFCFRVFSNIDFVKKNIEKGTGASYLGQTELLLMKIPMSLTKSYSYHFRIYKQAVKNMDFEEMRNIESTVSKRFIEKSLP